MRRERGHGYRALECKHSNAQTHMHYLTIIQVMGGKIPCAGDAGDPRRVRPTPSEPYKSDKFAEITVVPARTQAILKL